VTVRDEDGSVHATTVSSFFPVSASPPLVALSLGPNAQVLPWLDPEVRFVVSLLAADQRGLASRFTDSFPVGPSPWPAEGDPAIEGAVAALACTVRDVVLTEGDARIVVARVDAVEGVDAGGSPAGPLLYHDRRYRGLAAED
jgi:flavin reductase (DIM6/NTAB) family NADH-FMN oxidoreductase RutF